jgi:hypothetical protein
VRGQPFRPAPSTCAHSCRPSTACSRALSRSADAGLAFALLLAGLAFGFLFLGAVQVALVATLAFVLGIAGFLQGDRDRLLAALDRAALAARTAFQLAVLELVHHATGDALLACGFSHFGLLF